nr:cytidine deaminase [uncultured bacterium]
MDLERSRTLFQTIGGEPINNDLVVTMIAQAREARAFSYAPYSNYNVGCAALLERDGKRSIFRGTNIENAAYWPTMCAERSAIFSAASLGFRKLLAVAVVGDRDDTSLVTPCGGCRQVMNEFGNALTLIIMAKEDDTVELRTLGQLLPEAFGPSNLGMNPQNYMAKK